MTKEEALEYIEQHMPYTLQEEIDMVYTAIAQFTMFIIVPPEELFYLTKALIIANEYNVTEDEKRCVLSSLDLYIKLKEDLMKIVSKNMEGESELDKLNKLL